MGEIQILKKKNVIKTFNRKTCIIAKMRTFPSLNGWLALDKLKINKRSYCYLP